MISVMFNLDVNFVSSKISLERQTDNYRHSNSTEL